MSLKAAAKAGTASLLQVGLLHEDQGRPADAKAAYAKALRRDPGSADALHLLGLAEANSGDLDRAVQLVRRAVAACPHSADMLANLGILLHRQGRAAEALAQFDRALALDPRHAVAASNRGLSLLRLRRPAEALDSFDRALRIKPDYVEAQADRGLALRELGRTEEALDSFGRALRQRRDWDVVQYAAAQCRLSLGDFTVGWPSQLSPMPPRAAVPRWTGTEGVQGRTVLAYGEGGLGDTLQFCRYATLLADRGAKVALEVQPPLATLMRSLAGPDTVLARGEALPRCDVQVSLMSLPGAFGITADTIPGGVPYLAADPGRVGHWSGRLGRRSRTRVGVVWSGNPDHLNDHNRSMPFAALAPLLDADAEFVSLKRDVAADEAPALAASGMRHFGTELADFSDTAALAALMDVVVSVDTSVAHLAGALGRTTWVLLPWVAEWRWMRTRTDTPWYPTMRLFRQPGLADWAGAVREVRAALDALSPAREALPGGGALV